MECHNDDENQHKYWEVTTEYLGVPSHAMVVWGRLPGYGRAATARYKQKYHASQRWLEGKLREKFRKGYTRIGEESVFEESTQLKTEKLESVDLTYDQVMGIAKRLSRM